MHISLSYLEFDTTPHIRTSASIDVNGKITHESLTLLPFGDFRTRVGVRDQGNPSTMIMSLEEAEDLALRLYTAVKDARNGLYDEIDEDDVD